MPLEKLVGERTRKILEDLAERMIPSGGLDYPGARDMGLVDKTLEVAGKFPFGLPGLKLVAWAWEFSPLLYFKFRLLTQMSPKQQTAYFTSCENSRFMVRRYTLVGLKALFMAVFYNDPAICKKIGFCEGSCYETHGKAVGHE